MFDIHTPTRIYHLQALDELELEEWVIRCNEWVEYFKVLEKQVRPDLPPSYMPSPNYQSISLLLLSFPSRISPTDFDDRDLFLNEEQLLSLKTSASNSFKRPWRTKKFKTRFWSSKSPKRDRSWMKQRFRLRTEDKSWRSSIGGRWRSTSRASRLSLRNSG